ncbi:MAG: CapA family protein [Deltaproteobacteria bacterium]|nr:CapA family protein [Deltaproteobacteria bacterium]
MRRLKGVLKQVGRVGALALSSVLLHLVLVWLWNPPIAPGDPVRAEGKADRQGPVVVVFGGDTALTDAALPTLRAQGYEYALSPTLQLMRESDLSVVNLETAVSRQDTPFPLYKRYVYRMEPLALEALRWAGVDAVSLANNHIKDHDQQGIVATLGHLSEAGIVGFGAGLDAKEAYRGVVYQLRGTRVGLLSYLEDSPMHSVYMQSFAWGWRPGCARLEAAQLYRDIARMRQHADVVIAVVHWGRGYAGITALQQGYARLLVDAGADAVVGHHPHVHHAVGLYRGRPVLYSLGNYAFGTPGRSWLRHGLVGRFVIKEKKLKRVEIVPLLIQNRMVHFKPEPLVGQESATMLRELAKISHEYGARLTVEEGRGVLRL